MEHARPRYSGFRVGAAIETADGHIFTGINVESSSYGLTCCAERVALFNALASGASDYGFTRIAVATAAKDLTPPCGACRQVLWDYCKDIEVVLANTHGQTATHRLKDLLPHAFDSESLNRVRP